MLAELDNDLAKSESKKTRYFVSAPKRDLDGMIIPSSVVRKRNPSKKKDKFPLQSDPNEVNAECCGNYCAEEKNDLAEACRTVAMCDEVIFIFCIVVKNIF